MYKGAIAGQIKTLQDNPVVDATVLITGDSPSHKDIAALTNEQGEYKFDELIPGDYTIMANVELHGTQIKQARVEAGSITHLDFLINN